MNGYDNLLKLYAKVQPMEVDPQIVFRCGKNISVPVEIVLAQFKTAINVKKEYGVEEPYLKLKCYLSHLYGDDTIAHLEAM